jgi:hypothetical protein
LEQQKMQSCEAAILILTGTPSGITQVKRSVIPKKSFGAAKNAKLRSSHFDLDSYPLWDHASAAQRNPKTPSLLERFFCFIPESCKAACFLLDNTRLVKKKTLKLNHQYIQDLARNVILF